jgi:hypothetical protein
LDLAAIVQRLNLKPAVRIQQGEFVGYVAGTAYRLGSTQMGLASALRALRRICAEDRLALTVGDENEHSRMITCLKV